MSRQKEIASLLNQLHANAGGIEMCCGPFLTGEICDCAQLEFLKESLCEHLILVRELYTATACELGKLKMSAQAADFTEPPESEFLKGYLSGPKIIIRVIPDDEIPF